MCGFCECKYVVFTSVKGMLIFVCVCVCVCVRVYIYIYIYI